MDGVSSFFHENFSFLYKDFIFIPLVALLVFVASWGFFPRLDRQFETKILSQKTELLRLFDLMFVSTDPKRLNFLLMFGSGGLGLIFFFLLWPHFLLGFLIGLLMMVVGWSTPLQVVKSLHQGRRARVVDQMVDGLTIMSNGVKGGLSVTQAMERVVDNLPNPISQEFGLVLRQIQMGQSIEDSLTDFSNRIQKPEVQMFVTAINILKETGGNMAENFDTIVFTIRERQKIEKKIEAMTAQGLMQGLIVSLVPVILIFVFFLVDPNYIKPLFFTVPGFLITLVIFSLIIIGGVTMRKIVRIKV